MERTDTRIDEANQTPENPSLNDLIRLLQEFADCQEQLATIRQERMRASTRTLVVPTEAEQKVFQRSQKLESFFIPLVSGKAPILTAALNNLQKNDGSLWEKLQKLLFQELAVTVRPGAVVVSTATETSGRVEGILNKQD